MKNFNIPIYQVDAFSNSPFQGNPAAVCPLTEWLEDEILQQLAAENNLSETVYFVPENDGFRLRWFTPKVEIKLCGHATLATAWVLFNRLHYAKDSIKFYTLSGELIVTQQEHLLRMDFPAKKVQSIAEPEGLFTALGCHADQVNGVYKSDDLLVEFKHESDIYHLNPNFELLKNIETRGIITTCRSAQFDFISRWFGPRTGVNEDPVTGSAHTSLIPYWKEKLNKSILTAQQGGIRKGQLICELSTDGQRVYMSGEAYLIMVGEISFSL